MSAAETVRSIAARLRSATSTIQNEIAELRQRIAETRLALQRAQMAPVPINEIVERRIPATVKEAGEYGLRQYGPSFISGDRSLGTPHLRGSVYLPWGIRDPIPWWALCAARPDVARMFLADLVRQIPYEPGPASSERSELIARLERELAALEVAEEATVDGATEAGVTIAHRPEVVQRRQEEARARELEAEKVADRAARQAALDEAYRQQLAGGRTGRSQYLDGNR